MFRNINNDNSKNSLRKEIQEVRDLHYAGREWWARPTMLKVITVAAICVDSFLIYQQMELVLDQAWVLSLIVTFGFVGVVDFTPTLLAYAIANKKHTKNQKIVFCLLLASVLLIAFAVLFRLRWVTRYDLVESSSDRLGLASDSTEQSEDPAVNTFAILLGLTPMLTSLMILTLGVFAFDPEKKKIDLDILHCKLEHKQDRLQTLLEVVPSHDERKAHLQASVENRYLNAKHTITRSMCYLLEQWRFELAKKLHADGPEITDIMEK